MAFRIDVDSFTTLPRRRRDRLPTAEELQEMSLDRRLATLNISQARVPVPPPRSKRMQKRMTSMPEGMTTSPTKTHELYGEKSYSFDGDTRYISGNMEYQGHDCDGYYQQNTNNINQTYHKYEVPRKGCFKENDRRQQSPTSPQPMCDIIQSSQQTDRRSQMRRPDILRGSFNADLKSRLSDSSKMSADTQKDKGRAFQSSNNFDDNKNIIYNQDRRYMDKQVINDRHHSKSTDNGQTNNHGKLPDHNHSSLRAMTSTPNKGSSASTSNRFVFYRPKLDKLHKQHNSAIGLVGMAEVNYTGGSLLSSPEGSFVNPAFEIVDNPQKYSPTSSEAPRQATKPAKPVATPSRPVYSTMGSSFSTRPCTPSPPSHRFRNQKPPLPSPEPKVSPIKPKGPTPMKSMLSAKQLESSLKQYSSQSKLDTSDMCSPQALENMMKYYNMSPNKGSQSDSSTPPPSKLSSSKKNQSPYSSSGSLNVSGDSIDIVLRRKKKIKIRPPSISSDDESIKRVSLEINLTPSTNPNGTSDTNGTNLGEWKESPLSQSQISLNQQKLELDDLTSTQTAKLLRKQFAKLKVKASNLKVKDTELKQRFALLQNQRGRVCGGSVTKSKSRGSQILL